MGGSSKIPTYSGDGFIEWSKKMKRHLIEEGLWSWVEERRKRAKRPEQIKQEMMNDAKALAIIRESLSPVVFMTVIHAKTAKDAWDILHHTFVTLPNKKLKNKSSQGCLNDGAALTDPINEPSHGSVGRSKMKEVLVDESTDDDDDDDDSSDNTVLPDAGDDHEINKPLSDDKPSFHIVLPKSAVKPRCQLIIPSRFDSMLASNNVQAVVRFCERVYEIKFHGARKQKSFGSGWRQVVEDHKLEEGDSLRFKITKCSENKLEINMQLHKGKRPRKQ